MKKSTQAKQPPDQNDLRNALLNHSLRLATEFGENWLKPIQERLEEAYPLLKKAELNECNRICQEVMKQSYEWISKTLAKQKTEMPQLQKQFELYLLKQYPWVSKENLSTLHSQGCYYAWKEGLIGGTME